MDDTITRQMIRNIMRAAEAGVLYDLPPKAVAKIHKLMFGNCPPDILETLTPKPKETK